MNGLNFIGKGIAIFGVWLGVALAIMAIAFIAKGATPILPVEFQSVEETGLPSATISNMMSNILETIHSLRRFDFMLSIIAIVLAFLATWLILYLWDGKAPPSGNG